MAAVGFEAMSVSSITSTASGGSGSNHRRRSKVKCVTVADVYDIAADIGEAYELDLYNNITGIDRYQRNCCSMVELPPTQLVINQIVGNASFYVTASNSLFAEIRA